MVEVPDPVLVERVLAGDRGAFAQIYVRHQQTLARRLRRILVRSQDVEDVLQATFVAAFFALSRFCRDGSLEAWLHGIAVRCAGNHLRAQRRSFWLAGPAALDVAPAGGASAEDHAAARELSAHLWRALCELPVDKRIAFALHDLEELSAREVGDMVGCSAKTIWSRVESARRIISKKLRRYRTETAVPGREVGVTDERA